MTKQTPDEQAAALTALTAERDALQSRWSHERLGAVLITQLSSFGPHIADTRMMRRKVELGQRIDELEVEIAQLSADQARDRLAALLAADEAGRLRALAATAISARREAERALEVADAAAGDATYRADLAAERVAAVQREIARHDATAARWRAELERDQASAEAVDRIERTLAIARQERVA